MASIDRIQEIPLFRNLTVEELQIFADRMKEQEFEEGTVIFNEKAPTKSLFFILNGRVNIYKMLFGSASFLTILDKNDLFGEVSFIDEKARSASASTVGPSKLLELSHDVFDKISDENPRLGVKFLFELMKELSRKFRAVNEGVDIKSSEQTIYELIQTGQQIKISTTEVEYICVIVYADKSPNNPLLKIDVKGQPILLPFSQIKSITLPNKFGKF
jgi:CRP-like cAMP-binding protein